MTQVNEVSRHVPQKDYYTVGDAAELLQISSNKIYELVNRKHDPLPFRRLNETKRGMFIARPEFADWVKRNSVLVMLQKIEQGLKHDQPRR